MYAICNTKNGDVKDCVKTMKKLGVKRPIIQVGQKLYTTAERDLRTASKLVTDKNRRFAINMTTGMVHKEGCTTVKRIKKECLVGAYLIRPKKTGLKLCKHCC